MFKKFMLSRISLCSGIALMFSPFYFHLVDIFQPIVADLWFLRMGGKPWGLIASFMFVIGLGLIVNYIGIKEKRTTKYLGKGFLIAFCLAFGFSTWIVVSEVEGYFGIFFFVIAFTLIFDLSIDVILSLKSQYDKLESFEKMTVLIPVITIILSHILQ